MKKQQDGVGDWSEQSFGSKYCYGSLQVLPNFILLVGTFLAWIGALIPWVLENDRFGADLWGQNLTSAVMMYVFVLEPCMKQNDRQGSGYIFWLVGQLRCYPRCYTEFMDRRLKYYLFPDVWALLVMLGLNACGIPIAVPVLLYLFPKHVATYVVCFCASVFFVACIMIYRAAKPKYGGGVRAAFQFELDAYEPASNLDASSP